MGLREWREERKHATTNDETLAKRRENGCWVSERWLLGCLLRTTRTVYPLFKFANLVSLSLLVRKKKLVSSDSLSIHGKLLVRDLSCLTSHLGSGWASVEQLEAEHSFTIQDRDLACLTHHLLFRDLACLCLASHLSPSSARVEQFKAEHSFLVQVLSVHALCHTKQGRCTFDLLDSIARQTYTARACQTDSLCTRKRAHPPDRARQRSQDTVDAMRPG